MVLFLPLLHLFLGACQLIVNPVLAFGQFEARISFLGSQFAADFPALILYLIHLHHFHLILVGAKRRVVVAQFFEVDIVDP